MNSNSPNAAMRVILFSLLMADYSSGMAKAAPDVSRAAFALHPSPGYPLGASPPIETVVEIDVLGGEGETKREPYGELIVAQANPADAKAAEPPAKSLEEKTPEQKKRVKSAVILLSVLSGIALSGLLLIIASISIRGLQRKLAGPTRLDREPADLFPTMMPRPDLDAPPVPDAPAAADPSSQETRLT
jgi:hypothetical protein